MTQTERRQFIQSARIVVRDVGYVAQRIEAEYREEHLRHLPCHEDLYSQTMQAYDMACAHLTQLDPIGAAEFIRSTYGPSFRNTGVAR